MDRVAEHDVDQHAAVGGVMMSRSSAEVAAQLIQNVEQDAQFDDLIIEFDEALPVRVSEGLHDAVIISIRLVELKRWKRSCLVFKFKIQELGPAHGIILPGFVNLSTNDRQQSTKPSAYSKLARWWRVIADYTGGQRKRVSRAEFKQYLFKVIVTNVTRDNRERQIPESGQGQIVLEIAAIVQRLDTGQPATTAQQGYPQFIEGLGKRIKSGTSRCEQCNELTPFIYGDRPFCSLHAQQQAAGGVE